MPTKRKAENTRDGLAPLPSQNKKAAVARTTEMRSSLAMRRIAGILL